MKRTIAAATVVVALLAAGCTQPAGPPDPPSSPIQTQTPAPEPAAARPTLEKDGADYRIRVPGGGVGAPAWLSPQHLLVTWLPAVDMPPQLLLVDAYKGRLHELKAGEAHRVASSPDGRRAVVIQPGESALVDIQGASVPWVWQTGLDVPPEATWLTPEHFVLWIGGDRRAYTGFAAMQFGDLNGPRDVLTDSGKLAAVFPDGAFLVQQPWIDGALVLHTPPYDKPPVTIVKAGSWATSFAVSPDGQSVAWLEANTPPGDWSERLPAGCCSGDPAVVSRALVVYNRATGQTTRHALAGATPQKLQWLRNGTGVLVEVRSELMTALYRLTLDGKKTRLLDLLDVPGARITPVTEGKDSPGVLRIHPLTPP